MIYASTVLLDDSICGEFSVGLSVISLSNIISKEIGEEVAEAGFFFFFFFEKFRIK